MTWKKLTEINEGATDKTPKFKVSHTMSVIEEQEIEADYVVVKIDGKTYSSDFSTYQSGIKVQLTNTKEVGCQNNLWIKGKATEGHNHTKLENPVDIEINVYIRPKVIKPIKTFKMHENQGLRHPGNPQRISLTLEDF